MLIPDQRRAVVRKAVFQCAAIALLLGGCTSAVERPDFTVLSIGGSDTRVDYVAYEAGDLWLGYAGEIFAVSPPSGYRVWEELPVTGGRPGPVIQRVDSPASAVVSISTVEDPGALATVLRTIDADTLTGLVDFEVGPIRRIDDVTVTDRGTFVTGLASDGTPILQAFRLEERFLVVARNMTGVPAGAATVSETRATVAAALGAVRLLL